VSGGRRLPPLNALRAFEAAARLRSFAAAAKELHVTPAAISHQVKALESRLGLKLFRRLSRGLELTRAGTACLPGLREGFDRIAAAVAGLRAQAEPGTVTVSAAPSFATKWLAPRLHRFAAARPEVDVRISASTRLVDAGRNGGAADGDSGSTLDDADIAVRFGTGDYPGYRVERLLAASVTPVCSPRLLEHGPPLAVPQDLERHVLIHDNLVYDDGRPLWDAWLEAAGVRGADTARGMRFNHAALALEAAADGLGVALGIAAITAHDIASGRLVSPLAFSLPLGSAYYVVYPEEAGERPDVAAFREWLAREAGSAR